MAFSAAKLPTRFPVGTKFVIEGQRLGGGAQVFRRHLEFPDGTQLRLPSRPDKRKARPSNRMAHATSRS